MLLTDFLQSRESESVISLTLFILMMPLIIPSIVAIFPLRSSNPAKDQIELRYSSHRAFLKSRYLL